MRKLNRKGFSLVELVIVIAILGVLAALAVMLLFGVIERSRIRADESQARHIKDAVYAYIIDSGDSKLQTLNVSTDDNLIVGLQGVIGGVYGPYLEDLGGPPASAVDYLPQTSGMNGWDIVVVSDPLSVRVDTSNTGGNLTVN